MQNKIGSLRHTRSVLERYQVNTSIIAVEYTLQYVGYVGLGLRHSLLCSDACIYDANHPLCEPKIYKRISRKPTMTMLSSSVNNQAQQLDFVLGSAGNTGNNFNLDKQT